MMRIKIQNESVRHNVELFKQLMERQEAAQTKKTAPAASQIIKTYHAFVNRTTGDIAFPELVADRSLFRDKAWKPICLCITMDDPESHRPSFEVMEEGKNEALFRCDDLHPGAYRIMTETVKTLNIISTHLKHVENIDLLCKEIAHIHIEDIAFALPGKDIIHEAWHQMDRLEAEKVLLRHPIGTFLFRKGEYAPLLEDELSVHHVEEVRCLTLTYSESHHKISDLTLVRKGQNWFIYNNDPSLPEPSYRSIQALLETLKGQLKIPLLI